MFLAVAGRLGGPSLVRGQSTNQLALKAEAASGAREGGRGERNADNGATGGVKGREGAIDVGVQGVAGLFTAAASGRPAAPAATTVASDVPQKPAAAAAPPPAELPLPQVAPQAPLCLGLTIAGGPLPTGAAAALSTSPAAVSGSAAAAAAAAAAPFGRLSGLPVFGLQLVQPLSPSPSPSRSPTPPVVQPTAGPVADGGLPAAAVAAVHQTAALPDTSPLPAVSSDAPLQSPSFAANLRGHEAARGAVVRDDVAGGKEGRGDG